ncbi:MAG: hypothetical protein U9N05_00650 [Euryarchaeota archaeon]|nr:hypothetical protein [Euryarchaeota archaeon]
MPYLGDYIGHLLSEITTARVQADIEAVRVAELYASHPLLKHMAVPHFRLPTVTLDVPVAVKEIEEVGKEPAPASAVVLHNIRKNFDQVVHSHLKQSGIKLSNVQAKNLNREVSRKFADFKQPSGVPLSMTHIADELVFTTAKVLREPSREVREEKVDRSKLERIEKLESGLKTGLYTEFSKFLKAPNRLNVAITTAELREAGSSEVMANIHLSITEDAFEWTMVEHDGKSQSRLVPE